MVFKLNDYSQISDVSNHVLEQLAFWKREKTRLLEKTTISRLQPNNTQGLGKELEAIDEQIDFYRNLPF